MFPIELWNNYDVDLDDDEKRTNDGDNDGEGYNYRILTYLGAHPNIWKFIKKLKAEESSTASKHHRIENKSLITIMEYVQKISEYVKSEFE